MDPNERDPRRAIRKLNLLGFAAVAILIGGIGGWAATSHLSGAVIASGTVVVESNLKKVQHPSGGVVGEILVKEGEEVREGQIVMRLDATVTRATLGAVQSLLDQLVARQTRLLAERDGGTALSFPAELTHRRDDSAIAAALAGEEKLFVSRKSGRDGQQAQLRERIAQTNEEIRGLLAQQQSKDAQIRFISEELVGVRKLYEQNLVSIARFMQLQRENSRLEGERGQLIADMARARAKISETELQILQLDQDFRTEVLRDLREAEGKIAELRERVITAEDQLKRIDLRAPQAGIVHQLNVHTIGGVIGNGEILMLVVPRGDALVVEAKVAPSDIDQIVLGATATVRILAGNQRTTPEVAGTVRHVSADLTRETQPTLTNQAYYLVRVALAEEDVGRLGVKLMPGMPAEVFIQTQERTPLEYLLKPLREQIDRALRER